MQTFTIAQVNHLTQVMITEGKVPIETAAAVAYFIHTSTGYLKDIIEVHIPRFLQAARDADAETMQDALWDIREAYLQLDSELEESHVRDL